MKLDYSLDNKDLIFSLESSFVVSLIGKNLFFFISSDLHLKNTSDYFMNLIHYMISMTCITVTYVVIFFHFHFEMYML